MPYPSFWQHEVQDNGEQEDYCHTVISKNGAHNLREDVEHTCCRCETETYAERKTHDNHVALGEACTRHHTENRQKRMLPNIIMVQPPNTA